MRVVLAILVLAASLAGCNGQLNKTKPAARVAETNRLMRESAHSEAYIVAEYGGEVSLKARSGVRILLKIPPNSLKESGAVEVTEMELLPGNQTGGLVSAFAINFPRNSVSTEVPVKISLPSDGAALGPSIVPMAIVPMQKGEKYAYGRTTLLPHKNRVEVSGGIATDGIFLLIRGPATLKTWPLSVQIGVGEAWQSIVAGQRGTGELAPSHRLRFQSSGSVSGGGVETIENTEAGHIFVRLPTKERRFVCVEEGTGEVGVNTEVRWKLGSIQGYGPWEVMATIGTKTVVVCQGPKSNKTLALAYEELRIPFEELYLAAPDACLEPHWHSIGATATTVEGQEVGDPNRNGCGFGRALNANWELVPRANLPSE